MQAFERLKKILLIVNNILRSNDEDIEYILALGLKSFIERFMDWNNPNALHYCIDFEY